MGRPLNKRYLGDPAKPGRQVVLTSVWLEGMVGPESGFYIMRQIGTGRYQVTNGTLVGAVRLIDGEPLEAGKACLEVVPFGGEGSIEYARVIHNRSVKTWDGNNYRWSTEAAVAEGEADLPFAVVDGGEEVVPPAPVDPDVDGDDDDTDPV